VPDRAIRGSRGGAAGAADGADDRLPCFGGGLATLAKLLDGAVRVDPRLRRRGRVELALELPRSPDEDAHRVRGIGERAAGTASVRRCASRGGAAGGTTDRVRTG